MPPRRNTYDFTKSGTHADEVEEPVSVVEEVTKAERSASELS